SHFEGTTMTTTSRSEHSHASDGLHQCEACRAMVKPERPALIWKLAAAGAWLVCVLLCAVTVASAILMIIVGPLSAFIGMALLSTTHAEALRPARCPECGRAMFLAARTEAVPSAAASVLAI